jgi:micrococcal nuclease
MDIAMTTLTLALTLIGAIAIDGDTLKLNGESYRIWGIDAPERADPAGPAATRAMRSLIAGQTLDCTVRDVDRYGRTVVLCVLRDGTDIACEMVAQGHAVDWPKYSGGYYRGCE